MDALGIAILILVFPSWPYAVAQWVSSAPLRLQESRAAFDF